MASEQAAGGRASWRAGGRVGGLWRLSTVCAKVLMLAPTWLGRRHSLEIFLRGLEALGSLLKDRIWFHIDIESGRANAVVFVMSLLGFESISTKCVCSLFIVCMFSISFSSIINFICFFQR